jgi:hypothetical protein
MLRRNEAHGINVAKSSGHKFRKIFGLIFRRNKIRQTLPRIARAFDQLHGFNQGRLLLLEKSRIKEKGIKKRKKRPARAQKLASESHARSDGVSMVGKILIRKVAIRMYAAVGKRSAPRVRISVRRPIMFAARQF